MFWILVVALWAVMLLSPVFLLYFFLPSGRECPRCTQETVSVRTLWLRPVKRIANLRWCIRCGWEGVVRTQLVRHALPRFEVVPDDSGNSGDGAPWRSDHT